MTTAPLVIALHWMGDTSALIGVGESAHAALLALKKVAKQKPVESKPD